MKDSEKNILVLVVIVMVITTICHYAEVGMITWIANAAGIIVWLLITPFKLENNV